MPVGQWRVELVDAPTRDEVCAVIVQRDDRLPGPGRRLTFLADPAYRPFLPDGRWPGPDPVPPTSMIRRDSTNNAYAWATGSCAAARRWGRRENPRAIRPIARFWRMVRRGSGGDRRSRRCAPWRAGTRMTACALQIINGTSIAAPALTRWLAATQVQRQAAGQPPLRTRAEVISAAQAGGWGLRPASIPGCRGISIISTAEALRIIACPPRLRYRVAKQIGAQRKMTERKAACPMPRPEGYRRRQCAGRADQTRRRRDPASGRDGWPGRFRRAVRSARGGLSGPGAGRRDRWRVGTKLRIGIDTGELDGLGIDLVAMCVKRSGLPGRRAAVLPDFFATGKLSGGRGRPASSNSIAEGCRRSGCAPIGGETAEMPGMYARGDFDLAGFAVGAMERGAALPCGRCRWRRAAGPASDGVHSNGFALVRKVAEHAGLDWQSPSPFGTGTLGQALLVPTRLYVKPVLAAIRAGGVHAAAHITGGGITEPAASCPRGLAPISTLTAAMPPVFDWLAGPVMSPRPRCSRPSTRASA